MHFDAMPEWSFATLSSGSEDALLYRNGGHIDDKEIVEILPKAVFLRQANGQLCSVAMFADKRRGRRMARSTAAGRAANPPPRAARRGAARRGRHQRSRDGRRTSTR